MESDRGGEKETEHVAMANRIRDRRILLKRRSNNRTYTQQYVADRLGMSRIGYSHYEHGTNSISTDVIVKLAGILDVPINYFYGTIDEQAITHNQSMQKYEQLPPRARRMIDDHIESVWSMLLEKDTSEI